MKPNKHFNYLRFLFALLWAVLLGCPQTQPERSNPLDPVNDDPFQLQAKSFYGQIHLNWQAPANIAKPIFNIYRQHPDSAKFTLLDTTSNITYYDDDSMFVYNKNYIYRISVFAQNGESRFSDEKPSRPYRFPKKRENTTGAGGFIRGIQSKLNPSWIYVQDDESQTIQVFDISSNEFNRNNLCFLAGQKRILAYVVAVASDIEYILSISPKDSSVNSCKVEQNIISIPARNVLSLNDSPTAIASAGVNDSLAFVAVTVDSDSVKILKINYLTGKIIRDITRIGKAISFMLFKEKIAKLFLLSPESNKVYMLDKDLRELGSANVVGNTPINLADCSDSEFLYVCCKDNARIYSLRVEGNSLTAYPIRESPNINEKFIWVDCSIGEESDILFFYLIYDQGAFTYRVDVCRTHNGMNDAELVRSLSLEQKPWIPNEIAGITYVHEIDPTRPARNLYLFSRNIIRYFVP